MNRLNHQNKQYENLYNCLTMSGEEFQAFIKSNYGERISTVPEPQAASNVVPHKINPNKRINIAEMRYK